MIWIILFLYSKVMISYLLTMSSFVFVCDGKTILLMSFLAFSASISADQPSGSSGAFVGTHSRAMYFFFSNNEFITCFHESWIYATDKETDVSWDIFIIWKINSGLWTVGWAGLWKKGLGRLWATSKVFMGKKLIQFFFENIVGSALKIWID